MGPLLPEAEAPPGTPGCVLHHHTEGQPTEFSLIGGLVAGLAATAVMST